MVIAGPVFRPDCICCGPIWTMADWIVRTPGPLWYQKNRLHCIRARHGKTCQFTATGTRHFPELPPRTRGHCRAAPGESFLFAFPYRAIGTRGPAIFTDQRDDTNCPVNGPADPSLIAAYKKRPNRSSIHRRYVASCTAAWFGRL